MINRAVLETEEHMRSQLERIARDLKNDVVDDIEERQIELQRDNLAALHQKLEANVVRQQQPRFRELRLGDLTSTSAASVISAASAGTDSRLRRQLPSRGSDITPDILGEFKLLHAMNGPVVAARTQSRNPFAALQFRYVADHQPGSAGDNQPPQGRAGTATITLSLLCEGVPAYALGHRVKRRVASALAAELSLPLSSVPLPAVASAVRPALGAAVGAGTAFLGEPAEQESTRPKERGLAAPLPSPAWAVQVNPMLLHASTLRRLRRRVGESTLADGACWRKWQ